MPGSDKINYPLNHMYDTASKMLINAQNAQAKHEAAWKKVQSYIQSFPWFMQGPLQRLADSYDHRARASYDWQIATAGVIKDAADTMAEQDKDIAQSMSDNQESGSGHRLRLS